MKRKCKIVILKSILMIVFALILSPVYVPSQQMLVPSAVASAKSPAKKLTRKQAVKKLVKWLKKKNVYNKKYMLTYNGMEEKKYLFHYFEDMPTHIATVNWYYVHSKTGKITSMF